MGRNVANVIGFSLCNLLPSVHRPGNAAGPSITDERTPTPRRRHTSASGARATRRAAGSPRLIASPPFPLELNGDKVDLVKRGTLRIFFVRDMAHRDASLLVPNIERGRQHVRR